MRIARLDGLRGIAILLVFFYHCDFLRYMGWIGVDLFFVLSGFLITRILRGQRNEPAYWRLFYVKRLARLAPALGVMLLIALLFSRPFSWFGFFGYTFFLGDVVTATRLHIASLGMLWSLAVEEHFYLVWPGLVRLASRRLLASLAGLMFVAEPLLRLLARHHLNEAAIYFLTPFRLDAIALGSLLALADEDKSLRSLLGRVGVVMAPVCVGLYIGLSHTLASFERTTNSVAFNGFGYGLVALMCAFALAAVVTLREGGIADRILSFRPLVYVGRISYGMYLFQEIIIFGCRKLFHVPLGTLGIHAMHELTPVALLLTIAAAALSFQLLELRAQAWGSAVTKRLRSRTPSEPSLVDQVVN